MIQRTELVGIFEITQMLGVSRQRVDKLTRTDSSFPPPLAELHAGRIWKRDEIVEWAVHMGRVEA